MRPAWFVATVFVSSMCLVITPASAAEAQPEAQGADQGVCEPLDRGLVARPIADGKVYVGWRLLESDPADVAFNVYRRTGDADPVKLNGEPVRKTTDFVDDSAAKGTEHAWLVRPVVDGKTLGEMQTCLEEIYVGPEVGRYMVELVQATRGNYQVQVGASPRGSLALFKLSRANAALEGRDFVTPEDVKAVCLIALSHRIILKPEFWVRGIKETGVIDEILDKVPTPKPVEKG